MKTTILLTIIGLSNLVLADYDNPSTNKESAIKASGAYRQEFERRMNGQTGFENAAKGIQELSQIFSGPALPSTPNYGKSIEEHMADLVIKSLEQGATLKGIGIKNDDIIDAIDAYIKKNKKVDDSTVFLDDVSEAYEWKAELLMGIRDPGVVEKDERAGFKAYENALDYSQRSLELDNDKAKEDEHPEKVKKYSWKTIALKTKLANFKLLGVGKSKDVQGGVKDYTELAENADKYDNGAVYKSYCILIPIYAYGSEGFDKNLDKVVELSQKLAAYKKKLKPADADLYNKQDVCSAAQPFIQAFIEASPADMNKTTETVKLEKPKSIGPLKKYKECAECPEVFDVPEGEFIMGSSLEMDERPEHTVTISKRFAIGKTEVTRGQFAVFVKASKYKVANSCYKPKDSKDIDWQNLPFKQGDDHPVVCVSWRDAKAYTEWLSKKTKQNYDLPTEAQWEYACKAGEKTAYCGSTNSFEVAWYSSNSNALTHSVGKKTANAWGLFDMSGNAREWVLDSFHSNYSGAPTDGSEWKGNSPEKVLRGGSWDDASGAITSTHRHTSNSDQNSSTIGGFRVVRLPK